MRKSVMLLTVAVLCTLALVSTGCRGDARQVESCSECRYDPDPRFDEYCVWGENQQLYCANPCTSEVSCAIDHTCVPLRDQENLSDSVWVCMPTYFYDDVGMVYRVPFDEDCSSTGTYDCPNSMECLIDDSGAYDIFFCSESCYADSDCLSDCCFNTGTGDYCAPYRYCY